MKTKLKPPATKLVYKVFLYKIVALILVVLTLYSRALFAGETRATQKADWNLIVYLAANNNLSRYALYNINQMKQVGSNDRLNILVQLDKPEYRKLKHLKINPGAIVVEDTLPFIGGTRESLFECVKWATKKHPAKHTAIVLWNHGSGVVDPPGWGRSNLGFRDELLTINKNTRLLEINTKQLRGIAFNDTHNTYLDNNDLTVTLTRISNELLGGKKIDIVAMDACFMASVEIGSQIKNSTDYFVGSQDMEPGPGWNYNLLLRPFLRGTLTPSSFAQQMVLAYKQQYQNIFAHQTQSAIKMDGYEVLEQQVNSVATTLVSLLMSSDKKKIAALINKVRTGESLTTSFARSQYIDLHHFYKSLRKQTETLPTQLKNSPLVVQLQTQLQVGINILNQMIIQNTAGYNVTNAKGLSIYFPRTFIHRQYATTIFAKETAWLDFLLRYKQVRATQRKF
jgi:hypothetical protein